MYIWIVKHSTCFDGEELIFASRVVSIWGTLRAWRSHPSGKMPLYQKYDRVKKDRTGHQYQNDEPKIWKGKNLYCTLYAPDMVFGALVLPDSGLLDIVCMKPIWEVMQLKFHFGW